MSASPAQLQGCEGRAVYAIEQRQATLNTIVERAINYFSLNPSFLLPVENSQTNTKGGWPPNCSLTRAW